MRGGLRLSFCPRVCFSSSQPHCLAATVNRYCPVIQELVCFQEITVRVSQSCAFGTQNIHRFDVCLMLENAWVGRKCTVFIQAYTWGMYMYLTYNSALESPQHRFCIYQPLLRVNRSSRRGMCCRRHATRPHSASSHAWTLVNKNCISFHHH